MVQFMKIEVTWEVMPCRLVRSWSTRKIEAAFSRNVGSCITVYVVFYRRRIKSSYIRMLILFEIKINNTGSSDLSGRALYLGGGGHDVCFCVLSGSRICVEPITRPEASYRVRNVIMEPQ